MGFWSRLFGKGDTGRGAVATGRGQQVVVVAFRDLEATDPLRGFSPDHGYSYLWPFPQEPQVGQWAVAPGVDGPASVIVGAIGLPPSARGMDLKGLSRLIPQQEVDRARRAAAAALSAPVRGWSDNLREVERGQGWDPIEVDGEHQHRAQVARIFNALGYTEGGVTFQKARLIPEGRGTVRVEVMGEPVGYVGADDAPMVSASVARIGAGNVAVIDARIWATADDGTWRSRVTLGHGVGVGGRERNSHAERLESEQRAAERAAVAAAKQQARLEREQEKAARQELEASARDAGSFGGEHWTTRRDVVADLRTQGRADEAIALLGQCVTAAAAEAKVRGGVPEQWPTTQLGMILRDRKDAAAELALLEQYAAGCGDAPIPARIAAHLQRARLNAATSSGS